MREELLDNIKFLHEKIEEQETAYRTALEADESYDTLKSLRTQIKIFREELNTLELSLWDEFRKELL
jgi:hypothetical protein